MLSPFYPASLSTTCFKKLYNHSMKKTFDTRYPPHAWTPILIFTLYFSLVAWFVVLTLGALDQFQPSFMQNNTGFIALTVVVSILLGTYLLLLRLLRAVHKLRYRIHLDDRTLSLPQKGLSFPLEESTFDYGYYEYVYYMTRSGNVYEDIHYLRIAYEHQALTLFVRDHGPRAFAKQAPWPVRAQFTDKQRQFSVLYPFRGDICEAIFLEDLKALHAEMLNRGVNYRATPVLFE